MILHKHMVYLGVDFESSFRDATKKVKVLCSMIESSSQGPAGEAI